MVIKPIEFAMIQQQNNVSKSQHNIETRPMAEQQAITQQVEKNAEHNSQQVNKKDNADNENAHYDAKDKSNNDKVDALRVGNGADNSFLYYCYKSKKLIK